MATKQDAAEQAKEFLRQVIKYRFWIAIGVAALFGVIAYFAGSGTVRDQADKERKDITAAKTEVEGYQSSSIPTRDYMPIVDGKTQVLDQDVTKAWRTLFERQAPLLTWPESVQERFRAWGPKWPEKEQPNKIMFAVVDYIEAYPAYVSMVYKTCNPFDFETGTGIVSTSGEEELLRPSKFDPEHLPDLGKVWAAQERLWVQRTLLEVVAEVNKNAKTWDEAIIRQILELEVGNRSAQDQRSLAKGDQLQEAEGIHAPGEAPPADGGAGAGATPGGGASVSMGGMGGKGGMMGNLGSGAMGGSGLGAAGASESVFYVKSDSDKYRILPILMSVLIDQERVQDFLVELENSPMWIQVKDFELLRPSVTVVKPKKGEESAGMMMGMGGMGSMGGRMSGMAGMGGMAQQQQAMMMQQQMMQRQMMGGMSDMASMGRMGGGGGVGKPENKGKSMKGVDLAAKREAAEKAARDAKGTSFVDPYFNIVQVRIYGQARFFKAPPEAPATTASPGEVAAGPGASGEPATKDGATKASPAGPNGASGAAASEKTAQAPEATPTTDGAAKTAPDAIPNTGGTAKAAPDASPKAEAAPKADTAADTKPANPPGPAGTGSPDDKAKQVDAPPKK